MNGHRRAARQRRHDEREEDGALRKGEAAERVRPGAAPALAPAALRTLKPATVSQLQRVIGNQAVHQLVTARQSTGPAIQRETIQERLKRHIATSPDPIIQLLATHLQTIIGYMDTGLFSEAHALLRDKTVAGKAGYSISDAFKHVSGKGKSWGAVLQEVEPVLSKGMHLPGKLILPDVIVMMDDDFENARTPENDPTLASMLLPVLLEEWIHMFQTRINGYLSEGTERFSQTPDVTENQKLASGDKKRYDLKEVDIYAIYRDLGWNHILDAFRERYAERERYEEHARAWSAKQDTSKPRRALIGQH